MVWARNKLLIWDYIFEPVRDLSINYTGRNPEKFYKKIKELCRVIFNVPDSYIQEKTYTWEAGKDRERFEVSWEINKIFDIYSYITIEVDIRGFTSEGEGRATIRIRPRLITEYPQDTVIQQNLMYEMIRRIWHRVFYNHKRMEYLDLGKELIMNFERGLKDFAEEMRKGGS